MPNLPLPPIVLGALLLVVVLALLITLFKPPTPAPYEQRDDFLTPAELNFFRALEQVIEDRFYIFAKVRIGDLLSVIEGTENAGAWFGKIGQKHVDFMLADRESVRPVLVIELDDSSHELPRRKQRDEFVDGALAAARLPILRVVCAAEYSPAALRTNVDRLVKR